MSLSKQELSKAFDTAKAAAESIEKEAEPPAFVSRFERSGNRAIDKLDHITPGFNANASGQDNSKEQEIVGQGSGMVEKDKPVPELKPRPQNRKEVDRKAHISDMAKDDKTAKEADLKRMADQIAERQEMQSALQRGMEMGR